MMSDWKRHKPGLGRRRFLAEASGVVLGATLVSASATETPPTARYRAAVIGHTGRGNFGHGLDKVWADVPEAELVAVADASAERSGLENGVYSDYRKMLEEVRPDLVAVAPRWIDQHCDMVLAAVEAGVKGIYLEKPMCRDLVEADRMVQACDNQGVKLAIAFQTRWSPKLPVIKQLLDSGELGRVIEFRARGKEDRRGGGEDLWVLGTHLFNLIHHFGGPPTSCFARVEQDGHPVGPDDVIDGAEGIGPLAGDSVHAVYRLEGGATAFFDSVRDAMGRPSRFGLSIHGSKGVIQMFDTGHLPEAYLLPDSSWAPGRTGSKWLPISSVGVDKPEPLENGRLHGGNVLAVKDLIRAIEQNDQPAASIKDARVSTEMIAAVFESHRTAGPVDFPLETRENPLSLLTAGKNT